MSTLQAEENIYINQLALVLGLLPVEDAIESENTSICSLYNVRRTATSSVQIKCCWRPLAQTVLFAWHVAALELHSCGYASSPKRSKTTCCATPRL